MSERIFRRSFGIARASFTARFLALGTLLAVTMLTFPIRSAKSQSAAPRTYVYHTIGERKLLLEVTYPPGWTKQDKRPAMLLFAGNHKVRIDADGKLPPTVAERARLHLPVSNNGPGTHMSPLAEHFAKEGIVCFRVGYRSRNVDGVRPGEDVADAVHAIRWVRANAGTLGVDPRRVIAAGGSSGGYLASGLFALDEFFPKDGDPTIPARPDAILLYSPLVDWLNVGSMSEMFLQVLEGDKDLGAKVSPARHWRKNDMPPTLVMVGSNEPPFETVKAFAEKWKSQDSPMELFVADGGNHGFYQRAEWLGKTLARSDEFLKAHGFLDHDSPSNAPSNTR